jgi:hypothetical protein
MSGGKSEMFTMHGVVWPQHHVVPCMAKQQLTAKKVAHVGCLAII